MPLGREAGATLVVERRTGPAAEFRIVGARALGRTRRRNDAPLRGATIRRRARSASFCESLRDALDLFVRIPASRRLFTLRRLKPERIKVLEFGGERCLLAAQLGDRELQVEILQLHDQVALLHLLARGLTPSLTRRPGPRRRRCRRCSAAAQTARSRASAAAARRATRRSPPSSDKVM